MSIRVVQSMSPRRRRWQSFWMRLHYRLIVERMDYLYLEHGPVAVRCRSKVGDEFQKLNEKAWDLKHRLRGRRDQQHTTHVEGCQIVETCRTADPRCSCGSLWDPTR